MTSCSETAAVDGETAAPSEVRSVGATSSSNGWCCALITDFSVVEFFPFSSSFVGGLVAILFTRLDPVQEVTVALLLTCSDDVPVRVTLAGKWR